MTFGIELTSSKYGETLITKYTADGEDVSPEIKWEDPPASSKSFILVVEDPDAPLRTFIHWIIYNIKPDVKELHENIAKEQVTPEGYAQGINSFGKVGYFGPSPPGRKVHRYNFKLYAVLQEPNLQPGLKLKDLEKIIKDKTVKQVTTMAKYGR